MDDCINPSDNFYQSSSLSFRDEKCRIIVLLVVLQMSAVDRRDGIVNDGRQKGLDSE